MKYIMMSLLSFTLLASNFGKIEESLYVKGLDKKLIKLGYLEGVYEEFFLSSTKRVVSNPIITYLMNEYTLDRPKHEYFD